MHKVTKTGQRKIVIKPDDDFPIFTCPVLVTLCSVGFLFLSDRRGTPCALLLL